MPLTTANGLRLALLAACTLLSAQSVRDLLPEDGRAHGFDKSGTALDLSFVQLGKYLEAADVALDVAIAPAIRW